MSRDMSRHETSKVSYDTFAVEARQDFLKTHESEYNSLKESAGGVEIKGYWPVVRLSKFGTDNDGISRRLSGHFAQLFEGREPFVQLSEQGLKFYFNQPADAETLAQAFKAHRIFFTIQPDQVLEDKLPEALRGKAQNQSYRGKDCRSLCIGHLYVEAILKLAQTHPYALKPSVQEWYEAQKLDRAKLLIKEIASSSTGSNDMPLIFDLSQSYRISLDDQSDLVQVSTVGYVAEQKLTAEPRHVVILFDDSTSMMVGDKIGAANRALCKFITRLDNNTLVSIQPFNKTTVCRREPASTLKAKMRNELFWPNISARGATPLLEILANSSVFLREKISDLIVSEAQLNCTTIALLTDGESGETAAETILAMQTSRYKNNPVALRTNVIMEVYDLCLMPSDADFKLEPNKLYIALSEDKKGLTYSVVGPDGKWHRNIPLTGYIGSIPPSLSAETLAQLNKADILSITSKEGHTIIGGLSSENYVAYGIDEFRARTLPAVFPIAIGTDANHTYITELADGLHMPHAFIHNESTSSGMGMQEQLNSAMQILQSMLVRVPQAFIGLLYEHEGRLEAVGGEEYNIFHQYIRKTYFKIPNKATNVRVVFLVDNDSLVTSVPSLSNRITQIERDIRQAVLNPYLKEQYNSLKNEYEKGIASLVTGSGTKAVAQSYTTRGGETVTKQVAVVDISEEAVSAFKNTFLLKLKILEKLDTEGFIKKEIYLFRSKIEGITSENASYSQNLFRSEGGQLPPEDRLKFAQYTQDRILGEFKQIDPAMHAPAAVDRFLAAHKDSGFTADQLVIEISNAIQNGEFGGVKLKLSKRPLVVNETTTDKYGATPLISAIARLSQNPNNAQLRDFIITDLLSIPNIKLTIQDQNGNTALHRAIWMGDVDISCRLIELAYRTEQLKECKSLRNSNTTGASAGETVLDNIRRTKKLDAAQKNALQRKLAQALSPSTPYSFTDNVDALNSHMEPNWNTPIMQMLYDLKDPEKNQMYKNECRKQIKSLLKNVSDIDFLEANQHGDTALHYAMYQGEYELGKLILMYQERHHGNATALLSARNDQGLTEDTGGEVPYMNLVESGVKLLLPADLSFLISVDPKDVTDKLLELQHQFEQWLSLCQKVQGFLSGSQIVEFNHFQQLYRKMLEGGNVDNFLEKAPIVQLNKLIMTCQNITVLNSALPVRQLTQGLLKLKKKDITFDLVEEILKETQKQQKQIPVTHQYSQLFQKAVMFLSCLRDYLNGNTATLINTVEEVRKSLAELNYILSELSHPSVHAQESPAATVGVSSSDLSSDKCAHEKERDLPPAYEKPNSSSTVMRGSSSSFAASKSAGLFTAGGRYTAIDNLELKKLKDEVYSYAMTKKEHSQSKGKEANKYKGAYDLYQNLMSYLNDYTTDATQLISFCNAELNSDANSANGGMFDAFFRSKLKDYYKRAVEIVQRLQAASDHQPKPK